MHRIIWPVIAGLAIVFLVAALSTAETIEGLDSRLKIVESKLGIVPPTTPPTTQPPTTLPAPAAFSIVRQGGEAPAVVYVVTTDRSRLVDFQWDFGDAGSKYNQIPGRTAAHLYEKPGTYTITLKASDHPDQISSASVTVKPSTRAVLQIDDPAKLSGLAVPSNTILRIGGAAAGKVYALADQIRLQNTSNTVIEGIGTPVIDRTTAGPILGTSPSTRDVLIRGICFQSSATPAPAYLIAGQGTNLGIVGCESGRIGNAFVLVRVAGGLLQDNLEVAKASAHFVWMEGTEMVALGNVGLLGSWGENTARIADSGVTNGLLFSNQFFSDFKGNFNLRAGQDVDVIGNAFSGTVAAWATRTKDAAVINSVVADNVFRCLTEVKVGVSGIDFRRNQHFTSQTESYSIGALVGTGDNAGQIVQGVTLRGNVALNPIAGKAFVKVYGSASHPPVPLPQFLQVLEGNTFNGQPAPAPRWTEP